MNNHRYCVIMADGSGTPEQLKMTYKRFKRFLPENNILVITLDRFAQTAREVLPTLPQENLLVEPVGRKTAPCMAFACYTLLSRDPDAVVVATPWDLYIRDEALFAQTISDAFDYVEKNDVLMTLGIVPKTPDVNFGYIQVKEGRNAHLMAGPLQVKTFTEKPSAELAKVFVRTGEFFWNSGIFIWKASTICEEMEKYVPEVTELFRGWETRITDRAFIEQAYAECPKVSLDYGVMEHTDRAWLYPARFGWADIERL
ncbi:MAG: mannose-1-phosphate guanylyltransferase [Bacteroidales bacterium]|jgi:mannose-1-phosphate guanylyltransferase|nr:mannose-1-phosphate guanylyltransferase [Bacteroidales bacterium]